MRIILFLWTLFYLGQFTLTASVNGNIVFDNISVHDGLSDQTVRCIIQDQVGYIWVGTHNGLNRYDGNEIVRYYTDNNKPGSLKGSIIYCLYEDSRNNIWVGTWGGGLSLYNRDQDNFQTFIHNPDDTGSIRHDDIWAIFEDSKGNLWITTQLGLERFNYETGSFEKHMDDFQSGWEANNPRHEAFSSITEASDGTLWIGVWKYGVLIYDPDHQKVIRHLTHEPGNPNSLGTNEINKLFSDHEGNIWIGTYKGPLECVYSRNGNLYFEKYYAGTGRNSLSDDRVSFILQGEDNLLWIGTEFGLNILDRQNKVIHKYFYNNENGHSLASNHLLSGYMDQTGIIWLGTYEAGISVYDPSKRKFFLGYPSVNDASEHQKRYVKSIFTDSEGFLWVGTDDGLNRFSSSGQLKESYTTGSSSESLDIGGVTGIIEDWNKNLWVGTWGGGLHRFNKNSKKFQRYSASPAGLLPERLSNQNIRVMALDYSGNIVIGTTKGNLDIFNPERERFQHFICLDVDSLRMVPVIAICPEKDGTLWYGLSENGGVVHFDPRTEKGIRYYSKDAGEQGSLSSNDVLSLFNDGKYLWIGTKNGLNLLEKETGVVTVIDKKQGLSNTSVLRIEKDNEGNLWMSTIKGLLKYEVSTGRLFNYDKKDGALGTCIASWKDREARLYFGGINGLFSFKPSDIQNNSFLPPVIFTGFSIFNYPVVPGERGSPLSKHINQTDDIVLNYLQTSFSFEFAALNYTLPEKNQYRYKLEGFDQDWVNARNRNEVFYTNLSPGEYTFMVQGSNNDGIWNPVPKTIHLRVLPAPWKTWWAYSVYFIFIVLLLIVVRWFIVSRSRLETQLKLEKLEHERDTELSKKNSEIHEMKIRFFTNISHEFRTPLTLILSPLEKIYKMSQGSEIESSVVVLQRNAQRLLRLINQLLDLSKIEAGFMKVEVIHRDIVQFTSSVTEAFNVKAERMNIDYSFHTNVDEAMAFFDDDKLEKVLYNLLSNSFKFTPEGGKIELNLSVDAKSEGITSIGSRKEVVEARSITLTVKDDGPGIPTADRDKIFDYFYRPVETKSFSSSGLGLSLVYELVRIMKGTIEVCDNEGFKGTCFIVRFPVDRGSFLTSELIIDQIDVDSKVEEIHLTETPFLQNSNTQVFAPEDLKMRNKPLVLIVEDSEDVRKYLAQNLSKYYRVLEAEDGNKGVSLACEEIPDLIITDVMMPGCDGYELNHVVKNDERTCHIPVIMLTAKSDKESKIGGIRAGADDYIVKPFEVDYLISRVENLINNRKKLREAFSKKFDLDPRELSINSLDSRFLDKLIKLIEENMENADFGVDQIVNSVAMSRAQLYRKLKSITSHSVNDFVQQIRLNRAAKYILENNKTVAEITYMVGFKDPSYFTKCFRKQFDCLPSEFTRKYHQDIS